MKVEVSFPPPPLLFHLAIMNNKTILWVNRTTIAVIKEQAMLVYNLDRIGLNAEMQSIKTINELEQEITLSNKTSWSFTEFQEALEKKELELLCECMNLLSPKPSFFLCYLECTDCVG